MRRSIALGAVMLALLALVSGCVGIPTSGGVNTGPLIDQQADPDFIIRPSGPRPGVSPEELLNDFMLALRGPQGGYAIAREFFTEDAGVDWNPDASAIVRTGIPLISPGPTEDSLRYTVTSAAYVDADFRYFETPPAQQTLDFTFAQEGGEWRISSAPDGIVLSESSFNLVFSQQSLYFFDPSFQFLVPDVRWFPSRSTISSKVVRALLAGPVTWLRQGVVLSAFPTATTLSTIDISAGTATVELSTEARAATPQDRDRMRQQLAATLDVANVIMTVGGIELTTPDASTGAIKNPTVESAALVGGPTAFGFDNGGDVVPIEGLSEQVIAAGAVTAVLSSDRTTVVSLAPAGAVVARSGAATAALIDGRPGLTSPSIDPFRFVWSVQSDSATTLTTFGVDGVEHPIQTTLPEDARVVSLDVSRDGTRLLLYLDTPTGPQLLIAGIVRQQADNVPIALGETFTLPAPDDTPVDATWVDDRTVATLTRVGETSPITLVEIGGPSETFGTVVAATTIAGGNNAAEGLRVLSSDGEIWRPQGGGWAGTGILASYLGTKQ